MSRTTGIGSLILFLALGGVGAGLAASKQSSQRAAAAAASQHPEPMESVTAAVAAERGYRRTTSAIGTVLALRSIRLRNEVPGRVERAALLPGQVVEAGTVLVALDVSVEEAELKALEAQLHLAETVLARATSLRDDGVVPQNDLDRARAERDVALAQMARTRAVIAKKTLRAPFRARVGLSDVHPGQYLDEGTELTTLQGVDEAAHVEFAVSQVVAAGLRDGESVDVFPAGAESPVPARIVAVDARVDPTTRNAWVRARIAAASLSPGASVRVEVPVGEAIRVVAVPASALRKGPAGEHVFVIAAGQDGRDRAHLRQVVSGALLGDEVLIHSGLKAGERVAASGSFKLRESILVAAAARQAESTSSTSPARGEAR